MMMMIECVWMCGCVVARCRRGIGAFFFFFLQQPCDCAAFFPRCFRGSTCGYPNGSGWVECNKVPYMLASPMICHWQ